MPDASWWEQVADLTGELMRLAISGVAAGQREVAIAVCGFVQALYKGFSQLPNTVDIRGMPKKMDLMLQSLIKIENSKDFKFWTNLARGNKLISVDVGADLINVFIFLLFEHLFNTFNNIACCYGYSVLCSTCERLGISRGHDC